MAKYTVGGVEFDYKEEAEVAEEELRIIEDTIKNYNIKKPLVAKKLYITFSKEKTFKTKVGKQFLETLKTNFDLKNENNTSKGAKAFRVLCIIITIFSLLKVFIFAFFDSSYKSTLFELANIEAFFMLSPAIFLCASLYFINKKKFKIGFSLLDWIFYAILSLMFLSLNEMLENNISFIEGYNKLFEGDVLQYIIMQGALATIIAGSLVHTKRNKELNKKVNFSKNKIEEVEEE